ncbi:hypothetical protein ADT67_12485 [Levilactobacillus brevis]|uniref:Uncharacterized protein n=1 Tax=Levilactobacillus brevis TaxID=1580 RepID=A0A5B7XX17_LEVBR|nr:hypothetical protein ADT67_12485 [Levilactobacillus brevis]QCZ52046.1 hypothetical protein UCCLBBS449_0044 [Levilactobacillus brevis]
MNKLRNFVVLVTLTLGLSVLSPVSKTAQAATWHKGTPKALRGKWRVKHVPTSTERLHITKSHVYYFSVGPYYLKNVTYKKVNHNSYKVRGYEYTYRLQYDTMKFKVINHNHIKLSTYSIAFYKK